MSDVPVPFSPRAEDPAWLESDRETYWFKALCEPMRFEAALLPLVASWVPEAVRAPLATDPVEGWLLTAVQRASLDERDALRRQRSRVAAAVDRLADSGLPHGLQHGDAHQGNVESGSLRLFDFGDAPWALAAESFEVPRTVMEQAGDVDVETVEAAYAEAWSDDVLAINRAGLWWRALRQMTAEEWEQWGDSPREHLLELLEGRP